MDEHGTFYRILEWAWIGVATVGGYVMHNINKSFSTVESNINDCRTSIKELKESDAECEINIGRLRTHVSETYATKADMGLQYKMLHDDMKEIKSDIKTLISSKK